MRRLDTKLLAMTLSNVGIIFIENDKQNECDRHPAIMYSFNRGPTIRSAYRANRQFG